MPSPFHRPVTPALAWGAVAVASLTALSLIVSVLPQASLRYNTSNADDGSDPNYRFPYGEITVEGGSDGFVKTDDSKVGTVLPGGDGSKDLPDVIGDKDGDDSGGQGGDKVVVAITNCVQATEVINNSVNFLAYNTRDTKTYAAVLGNLKNALAVYRSKGCALAGQNVRDAKCSQAIARLAVLGHETLLDFIYPNNPPPAVLSDKDVARFVNNLELSYTSPSQYALEARELLAELLGNNSLKQALADFQGNLCQLPSGAAYVRKAEQFLKALSPIVSLPADQATLQKR